MQHLKTEKCVICGNTAKMWHGYVIAKDKMALGNYIDKKANAVILQHVITAEEQC